MFLHHQRLNHHATLSSHARPIPIRDRLSTKAKLELIYLELLRMPLRLQPKLIPIIIDLVPKVPSALGPISPRKTPLLGHFPPTHGLSRIPEAVVADAEVEVVADREVAVSSFNEHGARAVVHAEVVDGVPEILVRCAAAL